MANYTYPGVYVEEVSSGVRPIQAAGTSTAAFIGEAEKGSLADAVKIFSFIEYQNLYGGFLNNSFLAHSVYQFFNNGGTQCYIIRVAGENSATANIVLKDRGAQAKTSLTISASSPGVWGNKLAIVITNGTNDSANEFNLYVYWQEQPGIIIEKFENLSMVPSAANFVEKITTSSKYIQISVNAGNTNAQAGTSRGAAAPALPLTGTGKTKLRINLNGDGYQEINLQEAVGTGAGKVADLNTAANVASAIQSMVRNLKKLHAATDAAAFTNFTCVPDVGVLLLTSGVVSLSSSVTIAPASNSSEDASGLLQLGIRNHGIEALGAATTRPQPSPANGPFLVGEQALPANGVVSVQAGSDGDHITTDQPYIDALQRLNGKDDVSLIAVPGRGSIGVVGAGVNYCMNRPLSDCFFIGDMSQDDDTIDEAKTFMGGITPKNSYGALYTPWLLMPDPTGQSTVPLLVPPSGYVAGLYAKTDAQRGVWKAPAGTSAAVAGATGLAVNFTDVEQGNLNPQNINCIRQFAGAGIVLWGARTITSDPEYNYIPVRRMAIFLRVSIYRGIQWAVFEPNDEDLWASLRLNIGSFMMQQFRAGAFQGKTPSEAFFVKCDNQTTTQADIDSGIVNVLIGFAPLKPAEFVVVKISQKAGQTAA